MQLYTPFVAEIEKILSDHYSSKTENISSSSNILESGASVALRNLIPKEILRQNGMFFTSTAMASAVWANALGDLNEQSVIVDPACGAGDLLIPAVRHLVREGKDHDLGERIRAVDIESSFVRATRSRLELATLFESLGAKVQTFEGIRAMDFFTSPTDVIGQATHVVVNPPFTRMHAPNGCEWGKNSVNAAAVFVDCCLEYMLDGARLIAILPDVLRSGSRYARWRELVLRSSRDVRISCLGQFDHQTDVHVFVLDLFKKAEPRTETTFFYSSPWQQDAVKHCSSTTTVSDHFEVNVGSVVPHRHGEVGLEVPFVTARDLPTWTTVHHIESTRRYKGRLDQGPLVVVRRTSRPGESPRARATVITDPRPLAIENHLIVMRPKDGSVATCETLVSILRHNASTGYLDSRIRCRHLTVSAVRELPWNIPTEESE